MLDTFECLGRKNLQGRFCKETIGIGKCSQILSRRSIICVIMSIPKIFIRKYQPGDDAAIQKLVAQGAMTTVNPFFLSSAFREGIIQLILMLAAVLFIVVGTSLKYSLLAIPIVLTALYIGIYIGHWVKIVKTHGDLDDITKVYLENPRRSFWVAVLTNPEADFKKDYVFHIEDENDDSYEELMLSSLRPTSKTLLGVLAIDIKLDPDMREPPESVALLRRMTVHKSHRRRGVGQAMLDVALRHCLDHRFRAIELVTTEHHQAARNLYANRGFEFHGTYDKNFLLWGIVSLTMYRLRVARSTVAKKLQYHDITDADILKVD